MKYCWDDTIVGHKENHRPCDNCDATIYFITASNLHRCRRDQIHHEVAYYYYAMMLATYFPNT